MALQPNRAIIAAGPAIGASTGQLWLFVAALADGRGTVSLYAGPMRLTGRTGWRSARRKARHIHLMELLQTIKAIRMDTHNSTLRKMPAEPTSRFGVTGVTGENAPKGSVSRFRRKRFQLFLQLVNDISPRRETIEVADIGGAMDYWEGVRDLWGHLPLRITIFNIGEQAPDQGPYKFRVGDACDLSDTADNAFDLVHSNSVIEHVGHWTQIEAMAREIRRLAPRYFIQTPNFGFPLEPHFRTLFFQWYPEVVRAGMLLRGRRGFYAAAKTMEDAMQAIQSVNLLTASQMLHLFPDARLEREKLFGLTKSLISIR